MPSNPAVRERLQHVILNELAAPASGALDPDLPLFESLLDSTSVLALVSRIEEIFSLDIQDSEVVPANFSTLARLAAFVERKCQPAVRQKAGTV